MNKCPLCKINRKKYLLENDLFFVIYDVKPAVKGHCLIIPKRHFASFFDMKLEELRAFYDLLKRTKKLLDKKHKPDSYNIGVNEGPFSGAKIPHHLHIHVMPRYKGDVPDPIGSGVKNVVPRKKNE